ncbi:FeoC-like transcriptional regulator [Burkholderia cenocepacia]|uniref:FeoC-like transcriptional regulator n=1 Tax=Burkholderia cenocepacia TaxID=95486 RepID=UPI000AF9778C|nr:FeoC-like transcriptional regulator [Burkholderia cenocepacia]MDF0503962.1 FeoC-like transcriptional regulator [Burkholderia cenocepacia]
MTNTHRYSTAIMSDGQRILDVIEPGRAYEPARLASQLGMRTSAVRAWLEHWVAAGKLEHGMFQNADGGRRACFFLPSGNTPLCAHDEARRVVEVRAHDVLEAMKPGVGHRVREIATRHVLPLHRATALLSLLLRDGRVIKKTAGGTHRRHDLYYIAGTEPDSVTQVAATPAPAHTHARAPLSSQPAYDAEYARALRSLRDICTANRGRS